PFQPSRLFCRTEGAYLTFLQKVHYAVCKRIVRSHHDQIDFIVPAKLRQFIKLVHFDIHVRHTRITGGSPLSPRPQYAFCFLAFSQLPADGVLAPASPYDDNVDRLTGQHSWFPLASGSPSPPIARIHQAKDARKISLCRRRDCTALRRACRSPL